MKENALIGKHGEGLTMMLIHSHISSNIALSGLVAMIRRIKQVGGYKAGIKENCL